jgi:hypothetical protein
VALIARIHLYLASESWRRSRTYRNQGNLNEKLKAKYSSILSEGGIQMAFDLNVILDDVKGKLNKLVHLRITTVVGHVTVNFNPDGSAGEVNAQEIKAISTNIDLLQGDITTSIDTEFITGQYQSLWEFHSAREKQAQEIVHENIKAVASLIQLIKDITAGNDTVRQDTVKQDTVK